MLLVTGITGHSGRWFAKRLELENFTDEVRCLVRTESNIDYLQSSKLNISFRRGDLSSRDFLEGAMSGVDTIVHIANIRLSKEILAAGLKSGVKRAILVHTTGRYSRFKSAAETYIQIEEEISSMRDRIAITILRPTMIYGSSRDQNMYKLIDYLYRHKFFPVFGNGMNLMQPVHAEDLGNAYFDVLARPHATANRDYNLAGKEAMTYRALILTVSNLLNKRNFLVPIPMAASIIGAKIYNFCSRNPRISVEQVLRMSEDKAFPIDRATKDFGYNPRSFADGIRGEVHEYLATRHSQNG